MIRFSIKSCLIQNIWDLHICELLFDEILVQCHLHNYVVHYSSSHLHFKWSFSFSLFHWEIISPGQSYSSQSARIGWLVPSVKECQFQFWNFKRPGKYFLYFRENLAEEFVHLVHYGDYHVGHLWDYELELLVSPKLQDRQLNKSKFVSMLFCKQPQHKIDQNK